MAQQLTELARLKSLELSKTPQLVLEIDGVSTVYGAVPIKKYIKIGDPGLVIGSGWKIGGLTEIEDSETLITFGSSGGGGTTTEIRQNIEPDKGRGSSVSALTIALIDKSQQITRLISPGEIVDDILGRRVKLWLGFDDTSFKEDYIIIHRGIIEDVVSKAGAVLFTIGNSEQKKRQQLFQKATTELDGAITNSQTTITVTSTDNFLAPALGPNGLNDTSLKFYVRIEDEIIRYTGKTATTFTGCTRGELGTLAVAHDDETSTESFYRLEGNVIDIILKLYLSGWNGPFAENVEVQHIGYTGPAEPVANSLYFEGVDLERDYGLVSGDYLNITGSAFGGNNGSFLVDEVVKTLNGSYLTVAGTLTSEINSPAVVDFRSQYDTFGPDAGLKLYPDEVDISQHLYFKEIYLPSFDIDIYVKDTIDTKDWVEQYLLFPAGAYSIPRKARISVGMTVGPVPSLDTKELNQSVIKKPSELSIKRAISKFFYNTIVYRFDETSTEDKFLKGIIETSGDSRNRIKVGTRTLNIDAKGVRSSLSGEFLASTAIGRRLDRYKFAAEFLEQCRVHFGFGYNVDVGDVMILNGDGLNLADTINASRDFAPRFFEVTNKTTNLKTGEISFTLLDTGFSGASRWALVGPSSRVKSGSSTTIFVIEPDGYYTSYGANEGAKWKKLENCGVIVRALDYSYYASSTILKVTNNTIQLASALSFTPSAGDILELDVYNNSTDTTKLLYGFMTDSATFDDGKGQYLQL